MRVFINIYVKATAVNQGGAREERELREDTEAKPCLSSCELSYLSLTWHFVVSILVSALFLTFTHKVVVIANSF